MQAGSVKAMAGFLPFGWESSLVHSVWRLVGVEFGEQLVEQVLALVPLGLAGSLGLAVQVQLGLAGPRERDESELG